MYSQFLIDLVKRELSDLREKLTHAKHELDAHKASFKAELARYEELQNEIRNIEDKISDGEEVLKDMGAKNKYSLQEERHG